MAVATAATRGVRTEAGRYHGATLSITAGAAVGPSVVVLLDTRRIVYRTSIYRHGEYLLRDANAPSEAGMLILMSLATGPKHGYAMMSDIRAFADTRLGPGTLYAALARLEEDGLIAPVASDDRRRPYRITPAGLTTLRARADSLRRLASVATRRLAAR